MRLRSETDGIRPLYRSILFSKAESAWRHSDTSEKRSESLSFISEEASFRRIAEELVLSDITTGASQDIKQVTKIARAMVMQYGMSDRIGMINYDENGDDVFLGYDIAHNKTYSDKLLSEIDEEVRRIVDECYRDARAIIEAHRDILEKCCDLLMEKEKITGEEFDELFG